MSKCLCAPLHAQWANANGQGDSGELYLLFGNPSLSPPDLPLNGSNGLTFKGAQFGAELGHAVSGAGDFNGDGIADFVIGAPGASPSNSLQLVSK